MADDNDKSPLTRRRVLGGMATIGVAGAVGAGAWAGYSDQETAQFTAQAGTLDAALAKIVDGSTGPIQNGNTLSITVDELAPGDTVKRDVRVLNRGSVQAHGVGVDITNVSSKEKGNPESESDTGGEGELDDQLQLVSWYRDGTSFDIFGTKPDGFVSLSSAASGGESQVGGFTLPTPDGDQNNYDVIRTKLHYPDLDPSRNNKAMGDTVSFDMEITLYQNDVTTGSP